MINHGGCQSSKYLPDIQEIQEIFNPFFNLIAILNSGYIFGESFYLETPVLFHMLVITNVGLYRTSPIKPDQKMAKKFAEDIEEGMNPLSFMSVEYHLF